MPVASTQLPGIRFETVRPPAAPALPRMDIAAFAGFAARGPVGVPVAVEDVVRFGDIFGADLELAWDEARGERARAYLGAAVREFFRNGGRRCWVLRLADGAETAHFRLPGLLRQTAEGVAGAAWADASSPGSWADHVAVHAALLRTGLPAARVRIVDDASAPGIRLSGPAPDGVLALLRLVLPDGTIGYLPPPPADRPLRVAADEDPAAGVHGLWRPASLSTWFRPALPNALPKRTGARLFFLDGETTRALTLQAWRTADVAQFRVPAAEATDVRAGAWLRLDLPQVAGSQFLPAVYLLVDEVEAGPTRTVLTARYGWRQLVQSTAWLRATHVEPRASLVAAELLATRSGAATMRIADVALVPGHARYFGAFPDDRALHAPAEQLRTTVAPVLDELVRPRFPLAAPAAAGAPVLLPLGLEALLPEAYAQSAQTSGRTPLERDGLVALADDTASASAVRLFLDPDLAATPAARLLDDAFHLEHASTTAARPPAALHALLAVNEVSLLALPDAVHTGWTRRPGSARQAPAVPAAPVIRTVQGPDAEGTVRVTWRAVPGARRYRVEHATDPRFRRSDGAADPTGTEAVFRLAGRCHDRLYIRVRATGAGGAGPWSLTWLQARPADEYDRCGRQPLPAPNLGAVRHLADRIRVVWTGGGEVFRVERSPDPTFAAAETAYEGDQRRVDLPRPRENTYFRVAASAGEEESPWSRTREFVSVPPDRWEVLPGHEAADQRVADLHAAMLRFCAARGDAFTVLSLPPHHREHDALAHVGRLDALLGPGAAEADDGGGRVLSFGALYHPWPLVPAPDTAAPPRRVPPDGGICGMLAARARDAGAWAVPANRPLAAVVALEPRLSDDARALCHGRRVNIIAPFAEGFLVWSEETLSTAAELRGIGVRRLLILLRRLALQEGTRYVFQPHNDAFRRLVQRQFDRLLADLFTRGAFAGARPAEGYRVVTDATVNPPTSVEQGRLIVELRIAPSRPLHFLVVRLVQTGAGLSAGEA